MDFEREIEIDPDQLDLEWLRQPQLYAKYSNAVSSLKAAADRAKERTEVVRSELDSKIRSNPESYGLAKATDTAVLSSVTASATYQQARTEQFAAAEEYSQAANALSALEHRRSALENLVKLHLAGYFGSSSEVRTSLGERWSEFKDRVDQARQQKVREVTQRRGRNK